MRGGGHAAGGARGREKETGERPGGSGAGHAGRRTGRCRGSGESSLEWTMYPGIPDGPIAGGGGAPGPLVREPPPPTAPVLLYGGAVRCPEVRLSEEGCYCGNRPSPAGTQCKAPHGNPQWSRFVVCLRIGQVRKASMCPKWIALSFSDKPQDNSTRSLGHCPTTLLSFTQGTCRQRRGGLTRHPSGLSPLHPLTPLPAPSSDCVLLSLLD